MPSRGRRARLGRVIECQAMGGSEGEGGCLRTNQIGLDPPLKDCLFTGDGFSLLLSYELFPILPLLSLRTIIFSPFSIHHSHRLPLPSLSFLLSSLLLSSQDGVCVTVLPGIISQDGVGKCF